MLALNSYTPGTQKQRLDRQKGTVPEISRHPCLQFVSQKRVCIPGDLHKQSLIALCHILVQQILHFLKKLPLVHTGT